MKPVKSLRKHSGTSSAEASVGRQHSAQLKGCYSRRICAERTIQAMVSSAGRKQVSNSSRGDNVRHQLDAKGLLLGETGPRSV